MNSQYEHVFADWHPHFTPPWLSRRLAGHISERFTGTVVDPACGAGNLLAAAALQTTAHNRPAEIHLAGSDISTRAVRECKEVLSNLLPHGNFHVLEQDFLKARDCAAPLAPCVVLMNPPFRGYGELSDKDRRRIRSKLKMKGRFNLGHAFVSRAVRLYAPERLIALLPSNWVYSRSGWFRDELRGLDGEWDWEDVGDRAFKGVDVHLGILVWTRKQRRNKRRQKAVDGDALAVAGLEVRNGVATGADEVFLNLKQAPSSLGNWRTAVKGRDVGRSSNTQVWVPPIECSDEEISSFLRAVPKDVLDRLRQRSCVRSKRRAVFEYHDSIPDWFTAEPKLLLPEIVTGNLRVELDPDGVKMPLHSVIAIRVPSVAVGQKVLGYLQTARVQKSLLTAAPRLNGGAVRLQVGAVRDILNRWLSKRRKKRQPSHK